MRQRGKSIGKWSKNHKGGVLPCSERVEPGYFFGPDGGFLLAQKRYRVGLDFDITMQIKPRNISGILLAIQGRKDYLILQMVDGTMTFTVDNGRGPITAIFKPDKRFQFCDGNWHEIHGRSKFFNSPFALCKKKKKYCTYIEFNNVYKMFMLE